MDFVEAESSEPRGTLTDFEPRLLLVQSNLGCSLSSNAIGILISLSSITRSGPILTNLYFSANGHRKTWRQLIQFRW